MEAKIIVLYIGVAGIPLENIEEYVQLITKKITPSLFEGEIIVIPIVDSPNTRIECINPKYITDNNLIKEHTEMMNKLQNELQNQLEILKNKKNE